MLNIDTDSFDINNFDNALKEMITEYINDHKISEIAHEEITAMIHSDEDVAAYFYKRELLTTDRITVFLKEHSFAGDNLSEKTHIMIGIIDNLCHEVTFHRHDAMNYEAMTNIIIDMIKNLYKDNMPK